MVFSHLAIENCPNIQDSCDIIENFKTTQNNIEVTMNRRQILSWFGLGWLVSGVPTVLTACTNEQKQNNAATTATDKPTDKSKDSSNFRAVGTLAQLEKDGQIKAENVLIVRDRTNPTKFLAVNPTCTHNGCAVDWKGDQQEFVCPCHSATYGADGSVRKAPAKEALSTYLVKVENGQILIAAK
jgi:cytochrome b6-f complex iron-sulfur subunit